MEFFPAKQGIPGQAGLPETARTANIIVFYQRILCLNLIVYPHVR